MKIEGDPVLNLNLTSRAPQLTRLTLAFRFYTFLHRVNFANVTHLDLLRTTMTPNLLFVILKRCTNLQEGAFHAATSHIPHHEANDPMIVQDKLHSLTILANAQDMSFFPKIEYPSLQRLHYAPSDNPTWSAGISPLPTFYEFRHIHYPTFVDFEIEGNLFLVATLFFTKIETLVLRFRNHASEHELKKELTTFRNSCR